MLAAEPRSQHSDIRTEGCPGSQAGHTHPHQGQAGGTHGPGWGSGPQLRDAAPEPSGLEHASPHPCGSLSLEKAPGLTQGWAEIENRQSGILRDLESPSVPRSPRGNMTGKEGSEGEAWASDRQPGVLPRGAKGYTTRLLWVEDALPAWGQKLQA